MATTLGTYQVLVTLAKDAQNPDRLTAVGGKFTGMNDALRWTTKFNPDDIVQVVITFHARSGTQ